MDSMLYLAPVMGIVALLFAFYLASKVGKQDAGTDRMKEIAAAISDGAHAFLMSEYKILVIFVIVLFVLIGVGIAVLYGVTFYYHNPAFRQFILKIVGLDDKKTD